VNRAKADEDYVRVRDYLENSIRNQTLKSNSRLPTERELADRFRVGRGIARRALADLETKGLIYRHVGRGTFVKPPNEDVGKFPAPNNGSSSPADYIEARQRFEPEMALMIVTNADSSDFDRMDQLLKKSEKTTTMENFEIYDAAFHQSLAQATHNNLAIQIYGLIDAVRRREHARWAALHSRNQTQEQRRTFMKEHREIYTALLRRDANTARDLLGLHIKNTRRRIMFL
jgi:DNA-binding FadR family transcriptional regulator